MGRLVYAANVSLDDFLEVETGSIDSSVPDEDVHARRPGVPAMPAFRVPDGNKLSITDGRLAQAASCRVVPCADDARAGRSVMKGATVCAQARPCHGAEERVDEDHRGEDQRIALLEAAP
jgi:hypothetical protein